jgi:transcription elongation GreA/GreB family factor
VAKSGAERLRRQELDRLDLRRQRTVARDEMDLDRLGQLADAGSGQVVG